MGDHIDPPTGAMWAIIAICFTLIGAILTAGILSVEQRGSVLAAIVAVLGAIAVWGRRRRRPPGDDD
jgi:uncharacterized membrane protein YfcA